MIPVAKTHNARQHHIDQYVAVPMVGLVILILNAFNVGFSFFLAFN